MNTNDKVLAALKRARRRLKQSRLGSGVADGIKDIEEAIDAIESKSVAYDPIGWAWKNEMGITEVRTDRMSKEMIAKLNAFPVYAQPRALVVDASSKSRDSVRLSLSPYIADGDLDGATEWVMSTLLSRTGGR